MQYIWDRGVDLPASIMALENMPKDKWEVHVNPSAGFDGNDMCLVNDGKTDDVGGSVGEQNCNPYEVMAFVVPQAWLEQRKERLRLQEERQLQVDGPAGSSGGAAGQQQGIKTARRGRAVAAKPAAKELDEEAPRAADGLPPDEGNKKGRKVPLEPLVCGWAFPLMVSGGGMHIHCAPEEGCARSRVQ